MLYIWTVDGVALAKLDFAEFVKLGDMKGIVRLL